MNVYTVISIAIFLLSFYEIYIRYPNRTYKNIVCVIIFLVFFSILAFRECGFDYSNYQYYFKWLNSSYWKNNAEVLQVEGGYALLNYFSSSYRMVIIIMAFITCFFVFIFLYKTSPFPVFSLFLMLGSFYYPMMMGQYRQAMAVGICLFALLFKKKCVFILFVFIAMQFHMSSILMFIILFLPKKIYKLKYYIIFFALALFSNLFIKDLFLTNINLLPDFIMRKLEYYSKTEAGLVLGINMAMLLRLTTFVLFYYNMKNISSHRNGILFFNIYFVALLIYLGLGFLPQLGGRGSLYFYFIEIVLAAILINRTSKHKLFYTTYFLFIAIHRQLSFFSEWSSDYIPYKHCLF